MTDRAVADALTDDPWVDAYIAENRRLLADSHAHVVAWARARAIQYAPGVNAAFFLWVDLGTAYRRGTGRPVADRDIDDVVNDALLRNRVFLASGVKFGSEKPGWFRIVFSQERSYLDEGLKRIVAALHDPGARTSRL
jgi:aspartate/methionine/tyrosine aminotransferase